MLFDIARKLPEGSQVSLDAADNRMVVKAGRSRFQLPTLPVAVNIANIAAARVQIGEPVIGEAAVVSVAVHFRALADADIERYLRLEQPYDCAGSAKAEALGRTTQVWTIRVEEEGGKLVCLSRITLAVIAVQQA